MTNNFLEEINKLKENLKKYTMLYLSEFNIKPDSRGFLKCLDPDHHDNSPSMSWYKDAQLFHCFSCQTNKDIFDIANIFENKPMHGKEFIVNNLFYLAKKFNEPYEHINLTLTPEDEAKFRQQEIMKILYNYVLQHPNENYLNERKINKDVALKLGIGSVDNFKNLLTKYQSLGFTKDEIGALGISSFFINENKLIIMIKNHNGQPVSFTAREMINTEKNIMKTIPIPLDEVQGKPSRERKEIYYSYCTNEKEKSLVTNTFEIGKYMNGKDSLIFHKGDIFYGFSDVKKEINSFKPLIIVEG